jgi:hypothetical protein
MWVSVSKAFRDMKIVLSVAKAKLPFGKKTKQFIPIIDLKQSVAAFIFINMNSSHSPTYILFLSFKTTLKIELKKLNDFKQIL